MKQVVIALSVLSLLSIPELAAQQGLAPQQQPTTTDWKLSYALGMDSGAQLLTQPIIDPKVFCRAVQDVVAGEPTLLKSKEAARLQNAYSAKLRKVQEELWKKAAEKNLIDGREFMANNKQRPEVSTTPSGLQYITLRAGEGRRPLVSDLATVHYKLYLTDGSGVEETYTRGKPITFPVNSVFPGWVEGLQMMNTGSIYRFFIPSNLAYGEKGRRPIGPNLSLILDIELLAIAGEPQSLIPEELRDQIEEGL